MDTLSKVQLKFIKHALEYANWKKLAFEDKVDFSVNLKKMNSAAVKVKKLCNDLKSQGELQLLEVFMYHENKYVRCVAASWCLLSYPIDAEKILTQLIELPEPNIVGIEAKMALDIWKKGLA